jgi:hypothetical protein
MTAKDMLAEVLRRGVLTARERESFTDMWDRIHRFKRCSDKQKAWIEKVYFAQKLGEPPPGPVRRRVIVPSWQRDEQGNGQRATDGLPMEMGQTTSVKGVKNQRVEGAAAVPLEPITPSRQVLLPKRRHFQNGGAAFPASGSTATNSKIGYINYPGVQREMLVTSVSSFEGICPRITQGSRQYQKIVEFFKRGGVVLKVKPLAETSQVA